MTLFTRRLRERCADVGDWIDYRRDASFWPLFAVPPMLSVAWAYGGWIGFGVLLTAALLLTLAAGGIVCASVAAWIGAKVALDLAAPFYARLIHALGALKSASWSVPSSRSSPS